MAIEVNGVSLPDIPEGALDNNSYAIIVKDETASIESYLLYCLSSPVMFIQAGTELIGTDYDQLAGFGNGYTLRAYVVGASTDWGSETTSADGLALKTDTHTILWSNHNIVYLVGFNMETYEPVFGDVYFEDNSYAYEEAYEVATSQIKAIATQARRLCSTSEKATIDRIVAMLEGVEVPTTANWIGHASYAMTVFNPDTGSFDEAYRLRSETESFDIPHGFAVCDGHHPVKEAVLPNATHIGEYSFAKCTSLETVDAPLLETIGQAAFSGCTALSNINGNVLNIADIPRSAFFDCDGLVKLDFPIASSIGDLAFGNGNFEAIILRKSDSICTLSDEYAFSGGTGTKYIYVPKALLSQYKAAANWNSLIQAELRAIEDYPDICGTT